MYLSLALCKIINYKYHHVDIKIMNNCSICGETYLPQTEAHIIENMCYSCLFDPDREDDESICNYDNGSNV